MISFPCFLFELLDTRIYKGVIRDASSSRRSKQHLTIFYPTLSVINGSGAGIASESLRAISLWKYRHSMPGDKMEGSVRMISPAGVLTIHLQFSASDLSSISQIDPSGSFSLPSLRPTWVKEEMHQPRVDQYRRFLLTKKVDASLNRIFP